MKRTLSTAPYGPSPIRHPHSSPRRTRRPSGNARATRAAGCSSIPAATIRGGGAKCGSAAIARKCGDFAKMCDRLSLAPQPVVCVNVVPVVGGLEEAAVIRAEMRLHYVFVQGHTETWLVGNRNEPVVHDWFFDALHQ